MDPSMDLCISSANYLSIIVPDLSQTCGQKKTFQFLYRLQQTLLSQLDAHLPPPLFMPLATFSR